MSHSAYEVCTAGMLQNSFEINIIHCRRQKNRKAYCRKKLLIHKRYTLTVDFTGDFLQLSLTAELTAVKC